MGRMTVQVVSGYDEVGKSAVLVEAGGKRILLDYGMKLVPKQEPVFPPPVEDVDAVLLTHAHLDHSGAIPTLFKNGRGPAIYGIDVTREYSDILLSDAIKVARIRGHSIPFGMREVRTTLSRFRYVEYGVPFRIGEVEVIPFNAGHIPGSAMYYLSYDGRSMLYTGDFNLTETRLMPRADLDIPRVDLLVMESTYAYREHPERSGQEQLLRNLVEDALKRGGSAVVAGFAIGRLVEVAMALRSRGFRGPLFLDGMAKRGLDITEAFADRVKDPDYLRYVSRGIRRVNGWNLRKRIASSRSVILTTSGMLEGGPVHFYIKRLKDDPNSSLTLTGYQIQGTEGRRLLEEGKMTLDDEEVRVEMRVTQLNFSAHASRRNLLELIREISPKTVIPMHGDATDRFAEEISERYGISAFSIGGLGEEVTI